MPSLISVQVRTASADCGLRTGPPKREGRNADCECGLRTANGVSEAGFAGMRTASADCGLRTGCPRQSSQECGLRALHTDPKCHILGFDPSSSACSHLQNTDCALRVGVQLYSCYLYGLRTFQSYIV